MGKRGKTRKKKIRGTNEGENTGVTLGKERKAGGRDGSASRVETRWLGKVRTVRRRG